ncbi:S-layer homology domain-containing protein [Lusitaniella coriacea LEGE 07157]|uniref:S-layer homology domain-containing protein n=1 Tax=Lusitaniella coriacea LEGE 07157 TaxID=945747 RepID=A0A8J7DWU6_9CYAN|nr:S-layer homology domain-containing protein [Lusitaniella coriacea]MBE9116330.1 S-layer homology domain-containing protein [Lusitaniella coriacea LEGE 07157]
MNALYVDPTHGNDSAVGSAAAPLRTIAAALKQATAPTTIQLAPGTYSADRGEVFPLRVPEGIVLMGNKRDRGQDTLILGSGSYNSPTFQRQNVTILLETGAQLLGVTVTNSTAKGTGIWLESTSPTIARNTLANCQREGIFVTGNGKPVIQDNRFLNNAASGIFLVRHSKGEVRLNTFEKTGYGIAASDESAPLVSDNQLTHNRTGIHLSRQAKPVLRRNLFANNSQGGLVVKDKAQPDLGGSQNPAGNLFRDNQQFDLDNQTGTAIASAGNQLNPVRVRGEVDFVVATVKATLLGPTRFNDTAGHWAEVFIDRLVERGLISGFPDGSFKPEASLTRAEYAALIAKSFNLPRQLGRSGQFRDVSRSFWGRDAIAKAAEMGFISGFGDKTFRPQQNLTRVQALVSLVSGLGLQGGTSDALLGYRDRAEIPPYATDAIATATQHRLVVNYPNPKELNPLRDISRAEIAALLYQALVATGEAQAVPSPYLINADPLLLSFTDIQSHWAADFIRRLGSLELISGFADGSFQPNRSINRAEYAALIVKVFNPQPLRPLVKFLDVDPNFWGLGAIQQAYRAGFLSGFPDGTFHPEQTLHRVHLIVSLASGLSLPAAETSQLKAYADRATIPSYARAAVAAATQAEIVVIHPQPKDLTQNATRAEATAMVYQALVYTGRVNEIDSPYIVRLK